MSAVFRAYRLQLKVQQVITNAMGLGLITEKL
jgi:hypothetical protein